MSEFLSDLPCENDNARLRTVPLTALSDQVGIINPFFYKNDLRISSAGKYMKIIRIKQ